MQSQPQAIWWIGDSTVQHNRIDTWPQCGMGQVLELYLRPGTPVHNHARNGRSTKSFRKEGLFAPVEAGLRPGDLLLIQFGHNDEKKEDPSRFTSPEAYAANLLAYARTALDLGALPVLITPLVRRRFQDSRLLPTHGPWPDAARRLAEREHLPLIDLTRESAALVRAMGPENSLSLYMHLAPGLYSTYPDGLADDTHLRYEGAVRFAGLVARGLMELGDSYAAPLLPQWNGSLPASFSNFG